jgi:FkbM family methyltransferase
MRLNAVQKVQAAFSALKYRDELKQLLIRRHWQKYKTFKIEAGGVTALFDTSDFLSNIFFWHGDFSGYEPSLCAFLGKRIKSSKVYADVGGNVGVFSILPAMINPDCRIFCFEPDVTITPLILRNMKLNGLDESRFKIISAAAGDLEDKLEYHPHAYGFFANICKEDISIYNVRYNAPIVRLDDYFRDQDADPDLLKIDIDGGEMSALRGMSRILKESKPDLLLEVHPVHLLRLGSSASEVCDFLRQFDYQFFLLDDFRNSTMSQLTQIFNFDKLASTTGDMIFVSAKTPG